MRWNLAAAFASTCPIFHALIRQAKLPDFLDEPHTAYADSVLATFTLREQRQLLMPPIYAHAMRELDEMERWVETHQLGGVIAMQGAPAPYAERLRRLQDRVQIPLLVSTDAEEAVGCIDSTRSWPRALTLALPHTALTRAFGREVGRSLQAMGMHVNSLRWSMSTATRLNSSSAAVHLEAAPNWLGSWGPYFGLQDAGVLATATSPAMATRTPTRYALPIIRHDRSRLDSIELAPFRTLIEEGAGAMMAAHLYIPSLDSTPPTLLPGCRSIVQGICAMNWALGWCSPTP